MLVTKGGFAMRTVSLPGALVLLAAAASAQATLGTIRAANVATIRSNNGLAGPRSGQVALGVEF
jgi:hypothetical protein